MILSDQLVLLAIFILPIISLVLQALVYPILNVRFSEKLTQIYFTLAGLLSIALTIGLFYTGVPSQLTLYGFSYQVDTSPLNIIFCLFSLTLLNIVNRFSFDYIHKEKGFYKFFININLFWLGILLFIWSDADFYLFAGWEFIGISSIFLIAFYDYRKGPIESSITVMSYYKVADILLITSLLSITHLSSMNSIYSEEIQSLAIFGFIFAGLIKSGSFPFTSWLPRAMEGPTPSSSIYYTALAVNTGVLLLIKKSDLILASELHQLVLIIMGIFTIIYSGIVARVQTDAKNSLVYASSFQIGFVLIEIALGYNELAVFHLFSNSLLKTYQLLRTPSYLHIYNQMQGNYGKLFSAKGKVFQFILPTRLHNFLYRISYNHFYLDDFFYQLGALIDFASRVSRKLLLPIISFNKHERKKSLIWLLYFIIATILIKRNAVMLQENFIDYVPIVLLFVSLALLGAVDLYEFIGAFIIYKIVEQIIANTVHINEPFQITSILIVIVFVSLIMYVNRIRFSRKERSLQNLIETLTIFFMLYFTNFPFLLQSLMNEHLLEHFLQNFNILDLSVYAAANTIMNIALYNKVFEYVYHFDENGST